MRVWLGVMLALLLALLGVTAHDRHQTLALTEARQAHEQAAAEAQQAERNRRLEQQHAQAADAIAQHYEEDKTHALEAATRLEADLRAARLRLRKPWRCTPAAAVSAMGPGTGELDALADDRTASAGHLVRVADEADAQILDGALAVQVTGATAVPSMLCGVCPKRHGDAGFRL